MMQSASVSRKTGSGEQGDEEITRLEFLLPFTLGSEEYGIDILKFKRDPRLRGSHKNRKCT